MNYHKSHTEHPEDTMNTDCPTCHQPWAISPGTRQASPGRRVTTTARVPREDIFGDRLGGTVTKTTSRWVSDGPDAQLTVEDRGDHTAYSWACLCGNTLEHLEPAREWIPCQPGGLPCHVRIRKTSRPVDLYSNPRHGARCDCCGYAGVHLVRKDRTGDLPACMTGWDGSWATRPRP